MKLQSASKREIKRIFLGALVCLLIMWAVFFCLAFVKLVTFDYRVLLGGLLGTAVAVSNFALLCITIQNAAGTENTKQMQAKIRLSYNVRLICQGAWVVLAFGLPWLNVVAAALPLLFPSAVIFAIRSKEQKKR